MSCDIQRQNNIITISGDFRDYRFLLSQMYHCINDAGYPDIVLDMSECTSAFQSAMLAICVKILDYKRVGVDFELIPPKDAVFNNLFRNTNWGYYIDPDKFAYSSFRGHTRVPATLYDTPEGQQSAVNKIVDVVLGAIPDMDRSNFAAFEWAVNEITDNVLVHSNSSVGGLIQVSTFHRVNKSIQFVVADSGIGISTSLKQGHPNIKSDTEALYESIKEGVTRDKRVGQGNGLFGTYSVCCKSNGEFQIESGNATLIYNRKSQLNISNRTVPFCGTLISATVDFSDPELLQDALQFEGKVFRPIDYIETKYESEFIIFSLKDECVSFGSRISGKPLRIKLVNLIKMSPESIINIDFNDVSVVSSSFADEAFGKLFFQIGEQVFNKRVRFVNINKTIDGLVSKAILQRINVGVSDAEL